MHLETLQVFCDLVETGSFSAAAAQNFITQSAVSQQVRSLEARFDRPLIERTKGNVQPTPAGQLLYQVSKDISRRYRDLREQMQSFGSVISGSVRLATVHSVGLYELSEPLKKFFKAYPQVNVHIEYSRSTKIIEEVLSGRIDLGIVAYPGRRPQISVKDLEGQTFVGYERDIPTRRATDRLLNRKGVTVRYVMEFDNIETIKRVVEIGAGVALVPEPTIKQEVKNRTLASLQLSDEALYRPLGILHRQGRHFTPAIERFIAELK